MSKVRFLGLDVHADTIAAAVAEPSGEVQSLGTIPNRPESIRKLVKKLGAAESLRVCYEAGPTGYVIYWQLTALGVRCEVVAPTLLPTKAGDRVKTDRRDAEKLPISTTRLKAVLEWQRLDAEGKEKRADVWVFSDEIGEPHRPLEDRMGDRGAEGAHGVNPEWKSYNWTALTPACQQAFKRINLHWHDLRHEYPSRLVELGVPLAQVRDLRTKFQISFKKRRKSRGSTIRNPIARQDLNRNLGSS